MKKIVRIFITIFVSGCLTVAMSCGGPGEKQQSNSGSLTGEQVRGSIGTSTGGSLAGWVVALVDVKSSLTRTAAVSDAGVYVISGVNMSRAYTMVLLSPTMRVAATLFQEIENVTGYYKQYFTISNNILPSLVVDGKSMRFAEIIGLKMTSHLLKDGNNDGIADGFTLTSQSNFIGPNLVGTVDNDSDGVLNKDDVDVDGDGLLNVFDVDDDNDTKGIDLIDRDSNGDTIVDSVNQVSDQYFTEGVEWIAVAYKYDVANDKRTISFVTKVREGVNPDAVQVSGPASLFNAATVEYVDENGQTSSQAFNGVLLDEGNDGDKHAGDLVFGRTITLSPSAVLLSNTAVFFQLVFGSIGNARFWEFPYLFAIGTVDEFTVAAAGSGAITTVSSTVPKPFGAFGYFYTIQAFDEADDVVWLAPTVEVLTENVNSGVPVTVVPTGISPDTTCVFQGVAKTLDRIPLYANYSVLTAKDSHPCPN